MSLLDQKRINNLCIHLNECLKLEGDIVEVGVFQGGSLLKICQTAKKTNKKVFGYDTFEGLPEPKKEFDLHKKGDFKSDYEKVSELFSCYENCKLIKGEFPKSMLKKNKICFAHIDVDLYSSVLNSLEELWKILVDYGIIIIDDYAAKACPGARTAVHEFLGSENVVDSSLILNRIECQLTIQKVPKNNPGFW